MAEVGRIDTAFVPPDTPQAPAVEPADFSMLGGPTYQLFRRAHLSDDALTLVHRRILRRAGHGSAAAAVGVAGPGMGREHQGSFLLDAEAHARFSVAMPLLVVAELVVHVRMKRVRSPVPRAIVVSDSDRPRFGGE
jgi:hypothetical protein